MGPAEIIWRLLQKGQIGVDLLRFSLSRMIPASASKRLLIEQNPILPLHNVDIPDPDRITIFDLHFPLAHQFDWNFDYSTGKWIPMRFAPILNTRQSGQHGDIKYVWEINRHQYLSALVSTSLGRENPQFIVSALSGWVNGNPYLLGPNWASSLELALRVISWAFILNRPTVNSAVGSAQYARIASSLNHQLGHISRHLSRYSSANNHLIGEAAGLYLGSVYFPALRGSRKWRAKARRILEREIKVQVTPDGVNREQSVGYHLFTLEFFLLAFLCADRIGEPFSGSYARRLKAMLEYLYAIATPEGYLPEFGDSDDGRAFQLVPDASPFRTVMELGGILFEEPVYLEFWDELSPSAIILLGDRGKTGFQALKSSPRTKGTQSRLFPEGGKAVLSAEFLRLKVIFDFGEHGYPSIAAHAHADALSIQVALGGEYILIDPGTYSYHSYPEWRTYFRSTAAHNTVRIDGVDQSVMGGRFLWKQVAQSQLLEWKSDETTDICIAEHHGYQRLSAPVTHRRKVELDKRSGNLTVTDHLDGTGSHVIELFFHLHEDCEIETLAESTVALRYRDYAIGFEGSHPSFRYTIMRGSDDPISGWRSRAFHRKIPINTLCYTGRIEGSAEIVTRLAFTKI